MSVQENSEKTGAALRVLDNKSSSTPPKKDLNVNSIHVLEDGEIVSTLNRIITEVPEIPPIPTGSQLFNEKGLPDPNFLKEHFLKEGRLHEDHIVRICRLAQDVLAKEDNLIRVPAPVAVCGDIHGQYFDLIKLIKMVGDPKDTSYLFLGDYVDRGAYSIECILLLYAYKINYPDKFFLLRGNHECRYLTHSFGFRKECITKYSLKVYEAACKSFMALPYAAIMNNLFFCCHGGISPHLNAPEDINKFNRFTEPPTSGLLCDILWSDPHDEYDADDEEAAFLPNTERHCSYYYTRKAVIPFLKRNNLLAIIRAHIPQDAGFRMYKDKTDSFPSVISMFSAPYYYFPSYPIKNRGAVLKYNADNTMDMKAFNYDQNRPYWEHHYENILEATLPSLSEFVTKILVSVLDICTEEELNEDTHLDEALVHKARGSEFEPQKIQEEKEEDSQEIEISLAKRRALRNKILAIARISRMFSTLREESENIEKLKSFTGGYIPRGVLLGGSAGINKSITTFEDARKADLANEALPPPPEEVEKLKQEIEEKFLNDIYEATSDVEAFQKRIQ